MLVQAVKAEIYTAYVDIQDRKANGKSWDTAGGAPDIFFTINGEKIPYDKRCKNSYRCEVAFSSDATSWYFEIYDKDFRNHDLIGKGDCSIDSNCTLGSLNLRILKGNNPLGRYREDGKRSKIRVSSVLKGMVKKLLK